MTRYFSYVFPVIGFVVASMGSYSAQALTVAEKCEIDWARATAKYARCLTRAQIEKVKKDLTEEEVNRLRSQCDAENSLRFAKAEARAARQGGQCATTSNVAKPEIPTEDFEWNGTFKIDDLGVDTDLTIRGKWQDGYFDVYMQQGHEGSNQRVWVENVIYKNHLYTITHEWPVDFVGGCVKVTNPITVRDLNGILASSRLVGREIIDGVQMNHFRTTCLSGIPFIFPFDIYSDIYVQPGRSDQFERWLQFGDGVGFDPQRDEWFFFEEWNDDPGEIKLPEQCHKPEEVPQPPCRNL